MSTATKQVVVPLLPRTLRRSDVCRITGCSRKKVELLCSSGRLKSKRELNGIVIARDDLVSLLEKSGIEVVAPAGAPELGTANPVKENLQPATSGVLSATLMDFFDQVYWPQKTRGNSDATRRLYLCSIRNYGRHLGRPALMCDLNDDQMRHFLVTHKSRGVSIMTANRDYENMAAMWRYAAKRRIVELFPTLQSLTEPRRIPDAWNEEQLRALFTAAGKTRGKICGFEAADWWIAIFTVVWWSGERIGAVLRLTWQDIDLQNGFIIARAETRKGGRCDAMYPIPPEARELLAKLKRGPDDVVFPWHLTGPSLYDHYERILQRAGLPDGRRHKFHKLRRSMASHLKKAGGDPVLALGHASSLVTQRSYLDPRIVATKGPVELLFSPTAVKGGGA